MVATKEVLMNIFFGGTQLNALEAFGPKKYRDMNEPGGYARVLKRPVILALAGTKVIESAAVLTFGVKAGVMIVGPAIYRYMGADPGSVDNAQAQLAVLLAIQGTLVTAGAHYIQTILQRN